MGINYEAEPSPESRSQARAARAHARTPEPEKRSEDMTPSELQARRSSRANSTSRRSGRSWQRE